MFINPILFHSSTPPSTSTSSTINMFPSSSNKPAKQWYHAFDSKQILQGNLEPVSALYFLHSKTHSGVRDYIINRLYDYQLIDIDFILPQLCHLYSIWPQASAQRIGELLIYKCS